MAPEENPGPREGQSGFVPDTPIDCCSCDRNMAISWQLLLTMNSVGEAVLAINRRDSWLCWQNHKQEKRRLYRLWSPAQF